MQEIFINLKRFDVPKSLGGICPVENPKQWIENITDQSVKLGIGNLEDINVTYLLPEALIIPAIEKLSTYPEKQTSSINIGCQGVSGKRKTRRQLRCLHHQPTGSRRQKHGMYLVHHRAFRRA